MFYIPLCSFAQVKIVRDPLACAYGLKNEQNEWLVQPQYEQLLFLENGVYACQSDQKWGIIKSNGKKIVEARYEQVSVFSKSRFLLSERISTNNYTSQKMGVIDTAGKWFLPQEFNSISRMENEHYLLVKALYSNKTILSYQSSIADSDGTLLFDYLDGILLNRFRFSEVNLLGNSLMGSNTVSGNVRLVNKKGEVISDSTYDMGMPCGENFIVTRNRKYGLLNAEGKTLVAPKYIFEKESYDYTNPLYCLHGHHQLIFVENGKRGILDGEWKETVPAQYERIIPLNSNAFPYSQGRYLAYRKEQDIYSLLNEKGQILAEADTLMMKMIPIKKQDIYEMQRYRVFYIYGRQKNSQMHYGILNQDGIVVSAAEYGGLFFNSDLDVILLSEKSGSEIPNVYSAQLNTEGQVLKTPLRLIQKIDNVYLFGQNEKIVPLSYSSTCDCWEETLYGANHAKKYGQYTLMNGSDAALIFDHKQNNVEKVKFIDWHSGNFAIVQNEQGMNLLHPSKGRLFKQNMLQINQQFSSINRIWCQQENGKWMIYDTLGSARIMEEFDLMAYQWDTMTVQQNYKKGLLDNQCKWIIKPLFTDLFPFTKKYYVAITPGGKVAVMNLAKPNNLDTSYTSFRPIFEDVNSRILIYCLEKNGKAYFFDGNGSALKAAEKELITQYWTQPNRFGADFFVESKKEESAFLEAAKDIAYSVIYPYYQLNLQQNELVVSEGIRAKRNSGSHQFKLEYANGKNLSLSINQRGQSLPDIASYKPRDMRPGKAEHLFELSNFIWQNNQWRKVNFSDLFNPKNEAYQTILVEAIQNSPDIRIDCNEPRALYEGASQFSFVNGGIKLYFFEQQPQAFQIIFTHKQLERIPSARWILDWL